MKHQIIDNLHKTIGYADSEILNLNTGDVILVGHDLYEVDYKSYNLELKVFKIYVEMV